MTRSPKSKQFRRCVRAILKGCPSYGTSARLYCGKAGRAGKETRAQAGYCMRKGRKDWAASKGLHGGFQMARRKRRRSYGALNFNLDKKKKLILLGLGAVGVAAIALYSGSASAATVGRPATIAPGKVWLEGVAGYYADPKTKKILSMSFEARAGQVPAIADMQARLNRQVAAYKAGTATWDVPIVQMVGDWSTATKVEKMKAAGF